MARALLVDDDDAPGMQTTHEPLAEAACAARAAAAERGLLVARIAELERVQQTCFGLLRACVSAVSEPEDDAICVLWDNIPFECGGAEGLAHAAEVLCAAGATLPARGKVKAAAKRGQLDDLLPTLPAWRDANEVLEWLCDEGHAAAARVVCGAPSVTQDVRGRL